MNTTERLSYGEQVRKAREAKGLTRDEAAPRIAKVHPRKSFSVEALRKIEAGETVAPRAKTLQAIKKVLGVDGPADQLRRLEETRAAEADLDRRQHAEEMASLNERIDALTRELRALRKER